MYLDLGYPDRGYPDRGYPDRGYPDRGYPDRGTQTRGTQTRGTQTGGHIPNPHSLTKAQSLVLFNLTQMTIILKRMKGDLWKLLI